MDNEQAYINTGHPDFVDAVNRYMMEVNFSENYCNKIKFVVSHSTKAHQKAILMRYLSKR